MTKAKQCACGSTDYSCPNNALSNEEQASGVEYDKDYFGCFATCNACGKQFKVRSQGFLLRETRKR